MPLGREHRLQVQPTEMPPVEKKQGFFSGMVSFYGNALSGAKNRLMDMKKTNEGGGGGGGASAPASDRAFYDNTQFKRE